MRNSRRGTSLAAFVAASLAVGSAAVAHEVAVEDGEMTHGKHALHDAHGDDAEGHIAQDVNYGFREVGHDTLGGVSDGHYTDVWADGRGYAYVGSFHDPTCDRAGVYISDIRDPEAPTMVGHIASPPNTRVNDVKTIEIDGRMVLIHTLEPCGTVPGTGTTNGQTGISLWDVTDPTSPHALKQGFMATQRGVHNTFPWRDARTGRTYLVGTNDDDTGRDTFTVDISKPQSPRLLAEVGLADWPQAQDDQTEMGSFAASFNHDEWVTNVGTEADPDYRAVISNWDSGFVLLDVNDPANPTFVDDSTYPTPDPITGFDVPEGNAHAAAFDAVDGTYIYAGDEDFSASRSSFAITSGPGAGTYPATEGAITVPISSLPGGTMAGTTAYVGLACSGSIPTAAETGATIALIQRGVCAFTTKGQAASAAGYDGMIVFNDEARGDALVLMGGDPVDIPGLFVGHSTGLAIAGVGSAADLVVGALGAPVEASVEYDGYGYFHLLDGGSMSHLGYYAPGQVNDEDYAHGFGDLTMHNVEGDPTLRERAFVSWYSLGLRAVEVDPGASVRPVDDDWDASTPGVDDYYADGVREVGRWIAPEGSNFWGVTTTEIDGTTYVLGSDRNTGLWIFEFDPSYCETACPEITSTTTTEEKARGKKGKG